MIDPRGVRFELDGHVGTITLDRPEAANAFDLPAALALGEAVAEAEQSSELRVLVVRGEGRRFCAGGDVAAFADAPESSSYLQEVATVLEANVRRLSALTVPVITAVQGAAAGAGLSFVLNADVVISARSTKFVMAYSSIGLTPDCGVSYLLPRVVGQQRALALAVTGRVLSAHEAAEWGLVSEVVDDDQLTSRVAQVAGEIAAGPIEALVQARRLIRSAWEATRDESARDEATTIARMVATEDASTRIGKFLRR